MYQPQQPPNVQHLYKTDLDRHLFTPSRRRLDHPNPRRRTVATLLQMWRHSGWSLWKSTITYVNLLLP